VAPGQSIAVFGTGSVGLSAVMAARLAGAARIVAVDVVPSRLELATELGATDAIDASAGRVAEAIRELAPHGVDVTLNTTKSAAVFGQAVASLAAEGVAGFVTTRTDEWRPDLTHLLSGGRRLQGIIGGSATPSLFIPMLIDYFRQGRFPFDRLITFYSLDAIADAFADAEAGSTVKGRPARGRVASVLSRKCAAISRLWPPMPASGGPGPSSSRIPRCAPPSATPSSPPREAGFAGTPGASTPRRTPFGCLPRSVNELPTQDTGR
jgi:Zinc-binding dehydrogenase